MKVLHLITGLGTGGAENMLVKVVPELQGEHIVCSLTDADAMGRLLQEKGIKVRYLGFKGLNIIGTALRLRSLIRKEKPDILNTYLIHANIFGRIIGRLCGVRKIICSVRVKQIDRPFLNLIDRLTSSLADRYTTNSKTVAAYIQKKLNVKDITIIRNGIDLKPFRKRIDKVKVRRELGLKGKVIGSIGRLDKQKDHETLLRAMPSALEKTPFTLIIIGDGKERARLQRLASELGIDGSVRFLGFRKDIPELLRAMDAFVLPTLFEGMSNAILEAMASGCPIVTTSIPENTEIVTDSKEALIVEPRNVMQLSSAITKVLSDRDLAGRISDAAYHKAVEKYSIEQTIKGYNALYSR